jgi:phytoene synthase
MNDQTYCADKVRLEDRDHYVAALYAPDETRPALLALYALSCELAAVPGLVSEPELGEIRLQWWRDAVEAMFAGNTTDHPILRQLAPAIDRAGDYRTRLLNLVDAQAQLLYGAPFETFEQFETFARNSETNLIVLAADLMTDEVPDELAKAAGPAGLAHAICSRLLNFGMDWRTGKLLIPLDVCRNHGLTPDLLDRPKQAAGAIPLVFTHLVRLARDALTEARGHLENLPASLRPALLPLTVLDLYFAALSHRSHDPLHHKIAVSPLRRQWRMMLSGWRGRF